MGICLDASVTIAAERKRWSAAELLRQIAGEYGDQTVVISAIAYTEHLHGLHRAADEVRRTQRKKFLTDLLMSLSVSSYTKEVAEIAARLDAEQSALGLNIPFADLLIGATALHLGFAILTANPRHFTLIPNLQVLSF